MQKQPHTPDGDPKGRPVEKTRRRQKAREREEYVYRYAKQLLSPDQVRAKPRDTLESWIGATLFVPNLSVLAQNSGFTFRASPNYTVVGQTTGENVNFREYP